MDFWLPLGIGVSVIALLGGIGAALRFGRAYWLIAGYNTMTKDQQDKVDAEGLARFLANGLFMACAVIAVAMVFFLIGIWIAGVVLLALLFFPGLAILMVRAQRFDRNALTADGRLNRKTKVILAAVFLLMTAVVVFAAVLLSSSAQPAVFTVVDRFLKIQCAFGQEMALDEISSLELVQAMPAVASRDNGSALGERLRGTFTLKGDTTAYLFTENGDPPFLHFLWGSTECYVNGLTATETESLYEQLQTALGN